MTAQGVVFLGPAGVGKTALWRAFANYLVRERCFAVRRINMDPGSTLAGISCDYDITQDVSARNIMQEQSLGPNGAILEACQQVFLRREQIMSKILPSEGTRVDYILIDTPGQLDSFVLQPYGAQFFNELARILPLSAVYLYDATAFQNIVNLPAQIFLNAAVSFQLQFEVTPCLSKADLVDVDEVLPLLRDPAKLARKIRESTAGVLSDLGLHSLEVLAQFRLPVRVIPVSGVEGAEAGLEDLYGILGELGCSCGDRS